MRPTQLCDVVGQDHLLADGMPLREAINSSSLHSMIFWGPPGRWEKTTLARLIALQCDVHFESISAVLSGVKEIRASIDSAKNQQQNERQENPLIC